MTATTLKIQVLSVQKHNLVSLLGDQLPPAQEWYVLDYLN
jgi:hypothetical protein